MKTVHKSDEITINVDGDKIFIDRSGELTRKNHSIPGLCISVQEHGLELIPDLSCVWIPATIHDEEGCEIPGFILQNKGYCPP